MLRSLWNAASGMRAQQEKIDVTANNIANVNTTGFKKKTIVFHDLLYQSLERRGNAVAPAFAGGRPSMAGVGSAVGAVRADMRAGTYLQTGRALDLAVVGEGFFRVELPDGRIAYTRDGSFSLDAAGNLVTAQGQRVIFPALPLGQQEIKISPQGQVSAVEPDGDQLAVGTVSLAYFNNPQGLEQLGGNLLLATEASGEAENRAQGNATKLMQGYLESSNVDLSEELVNLLASQRAFELNSRALRTSDEMWSIANQIRR
ncbi:MAG: flagellar basal-body rod protein FlgG [Dethiobacter sp.]